MSVSLWSSSCVDSMDSFDSFIIHPYQPSLLEDPLDGIQCLYIADECTQHWCIHVGEHKGELCLWVCDCFSSSYPACIVCLTLMVCEMGGKWPYTCYFVGFCFQDFLCNTHLAFFFLSTSLKFRWYSYTIVLIQLPLGRISFILSERLDFLMVHNLLIAVSVFPLQIHTYTHTHTHNKLF